MTDKIDLYNYRVFWYKNGISMGFKWPLNKIQQKLKFVNLASTWTIFFKNTSLPAGSILPDQILFCTCSFENDAAHGGGEGVYILSALRL